MPGRPSGVFLTDFGLAKSCVTGSRLTRTGETLGTPSYMAPEQARGELSELSAATDVWACGCLLYELVTARRAFDGPSPGAIVGMVVSARPVSMRSLRPDVPRGVAEVAVACLQKSPSGRPADAGGLRSVLDATLRGGRPVRRGRPGAVAAVLATSVGVLGLVAWAAWPHQIVEPAAPTRLADVPAAVRMAEQAWRDRRSTPRKGAELLGRALALQPDRHDWRLRRGLLLWAVGDIPAARAVWQTVPHGNARWPEAQLYLGLEPVFRWGYEEYQFDEGRPILERLRSDPGRCGRLARAALLLIEYEGAAVLEALADEPGWEAAFMRARSIDDDDDAALHARMREYTLGLSEGIAFTWAHNSRGLIRRRLGDPHGAIRDFDAANAIDPTHHYAMYNRALAREDLRDFAGAVAEYDAILHLLPNEFGAWRRRADVLRQMGKLDEALDNVTRALEIKPGYDRGLKLRAQIRRKLGDLAGALSDLDRVLELDPDSRQALNRRALVKRDLGDLEGALRDYDAVLTIDPEYTDTLWNRAILRAELGDLNGAMADWNARLAIIPESEGSLRRRAEIKWELGDLAGALEDLNGSLAVKPDYATALSLRGQLKKELGDAEGAAADLAAARRLRAR